MARPHPVVRISAEFSDGRGRCPDQADIPVDPEQEEEVLVAIEQGFDLCFKAFSAGRRFLDQPVGIDPDDGIPLRFTHRGIEALENLLRHIVHPFQETDCQSFIRKLLRAVHRPEAILQVVVFHAAVLLDVTVAAVMIRQQQSLRGNQLTRTAGTEQDDGILERSLVHAVYIFGRQLETFGLHVSDPLGYKRRQPHTLVGPQRQDKGQQG